MTRLLLFFKLEDARFRDRFSAARHTERALARREAFVEKFIRITLKHRRAVVRLFLAVMVVCACFIPFVRTNYNMVDYLPDDAQSTTAVRIMADEFETAMPNADVMVRDVTITQALEIEKSMVAMDGIEDVIWLDIAVDLTKPIATLDRSTVETYYHVNPDNPSIGTALYQVTVESGNESPTIAALRALVDSYGDGNAVIGEAADTAFTQDQVVVQVLGAVAILAPIIILLLIISTMSWIEPVLFLGAIAVSIVINMGTNIVLGEVSFMTFSISPILQLAVSLDYAIFLLHAFAAERNEIPDVEEAMVSAAVKSVPTIASSAITTLFGFAALAVMQFQIGADLGLNLVKGIIFSFITVAVFLPSLTLLLYRLIDKTAHRRFMPTFANIGGALAKIRVPALVLVLLLIVPAYLGQSHTTFTYLNTVPDPDLRNGADMVAVNEEFGEQNAMVVLVPRGDIASEAALSSDLAQLDFVKSVLSYASAVGATIPQAVAGDEALKQFYSPNYARIVAYLNTDIESEEAFAAVETVQNITATYYDSFYTAGQSANLYDMKNIVAVDNVRVSLVAIIAITLVLLITFRSLALPLALMLTIEAGIWINLGIPYFTGVSLNFIGYLVINTVQLGATIDYGILLTSHYLARRQLEPPREAVHHALGETFVSLVVSAGILSSAGFALTFASSLSAVSSLGFLLGRGALMSLVLVTCFLPALLVYGDGIIRRTTLNAGFHTEKSVSRAE